MSDEEDFEEQIRQEQLESRKINENAEIIEHGRIRKDEDGVEFEWDAERKAWFPRINEDFIANYQMQYGSQSTNQQTTATTPPDVHTNPDAYWKYYYADRVPDMTDPNYPAWYAYYYGSSQQNTETVDPTDPGYPKWYYKQCYGVEPDENDEKYKEWAQSITSAAASQADGISSQQKDSVTAADNKNDKGKKKKPEPKWFEQNDEHNTSVYVQGLPDDITEEEFKDFMSKCGLIAFDYDKKKLKLKLYTDKTTGKPKGDGLCTYIKRESVELAFQLLDDADIRGSKIELQLAKFELKGEFDPKLRRKPKDNKAKRKEKEKQSKLLDWRPDKLPDERQNCEKTVVLKNLFDPAEFDKNPEAIQEIRQDMRQECSTFGEIKKLTIYDRNSDGVVTVTYKEFEPADLCVAALNNRWFGGRRVLASNWNGKDKFDVRETAEQEAERLRKWNEYLESGTEKKTDGNDVEPPSKVAKPDDARQTV